MYAPVLITAPATIRAKLDEAKAHLRVDAGEDGLITTLIAAATRHLDGWTGVLGRCLCEQTWRQDFDASARELRLPLWPVISIASITWRNSAGADLDRGER